ncbi:hypothetical protein PENVUL_c060G02965, partial [Penicillium vulpinum]
WCPRITRLQIYRILNTINTKFHLLPHLELAKRPENHIMLSLTTVGDNNTINIGLNGHLSIRRSLYPLGIFMPLLRQVL